MTGVQTCALPISGKEFKSANGKHVWAIDTKITYAGGKRYIPVDINASIIAQAERYDESRVFEPKFPDYFRIDVKPSYRLNLKKITLEWNIDFQNITNHKNIFQQTYDVNSNSLRYDYQLGLFIIPQFRVLF